MKISRFRTVTVLISATIALCLAQATVRAADTNPPPRLTVELRDGSRVVGTSVEKQFKFHSELLGDLKLDVKDIRSVDCVSSNSAKLTMAGGDMLTVSFVDSSFAMKTGFGKIDLTVDSVRKFTVLAGGASGGVLRPHLPGLVALWSAEGDARDSIGSHNGTLAGKVNFVPGQIGQAFSFADTDSYVKVPASSSLDVGSGSGFTLTAWINPSDITGAQPIFEWSRGDGTYWGVHFFIDANSFHSGPGTLYANIVDAAGGWHQIHTPPGVVSAGSFQQATLTYDKATGEAMIYCNGVLVMQQFMGQFTPKTSDDLYLGHRPLNVDRLLTFAGALDEMAVYNRALSAGEIQDQCRDDNGGELPPPPAVAPAPFTRRFPDGFGQ
jgi:hypothetical protein